MNRDEAVDVLTTRVPQRAQDILVEDNCVFFTMPVDWRPATVSFAAHAGTPGRWVIQL